MPRALITGVTGQDGAYLARFLLSQNDEVLGMVRRASTENFERVADLRDCGEQRVGSLHERIQPAEARQIGGGGGTLEGGREFAAPATRRGQDYGRVGVWLQTASGSSPSARPRRARAPRCTT